MFLGVKKVPSREDRGSGLLSHNLRPLALSFYYLGPEDRSKGLRPGGKCVFLGSHLISYGLVVVLFCFVETGLLHVDKLA